jgi:hypothetical protein
MVITLVLMMAAFSIGPGLADTPNVCRLKLDVTPPAYYADDQCVDITTDPMSTEEQGELWYNIKAKIQGTADWTIDAETQDLTPKFIRQACGTYEVEVTPHWEGVENDCTTTVTKDSYIPKPGACQVQ